MSDGRQEAARCDDPGNFYLIIGVMVALALGTLVIAKLRRWI